MGVYSTNRFSSVQTLTTVEANESYYGEIGAERILVENVENDMSIFEALLLNDMSEAISLKEGTLLESELTSIQEASVKDFFAKIKEGAKKVWAKIVGLFKTFITRLQGFVNRDNAKFVKAMKPKLEGKNLSKMKYKWSNPTTETSLDYVAVVNDIPTKDIYDEDDIEKINKIRSDASDGTIFEQMLAKAIGNNGGSIDKDAFPKAAQKFFFDEEKEVTGFGSGKAVIADLEEVLINGKKTLKSLNDSKKENDTAFSKLLTDLERQRSTAEKAETVNDEARTNRSLLLARINAYHANVQVFQTVATMCASATIAKEKFRIRQARRVYAQAASYSPKSEDVDLMNMVAEAAEYEADELFGIA